MKIIISGIFRGGYEKAGEWREFIKSRFGQYRLVE